METRDDAESVALPWFLRVRWALGFGAVAIVVGVRSLTETQVELIPLLGLSAFVLVSNGLLLAVTARRPAGRTLLGGVLLLDTLALTTALLLTGGPSNPFTVLFLVYVALASVVLGRAWAYSLVAVTVACFGSLFIITPSGDSDAQADMHAGHDMPAGHDHAAMMAGGDDDDAFSLHLYGMFAAFTVTAGVVAYLGTRVMSALGARDDELATARARAARSERLASLTTLAAGAAHEMATPLGTIAVVAGELEQRAKRLDDEAMLEDARLIRREVKRCRDILDQLGGHSGDGRGALAETMPLEDLLVALDERLPETQRTRLEVQIESAPAEVRLPKRAFTQALANLIDNAFDASGTNGVVRLAVTATEDRVRFEVRDEGVGMETEQLAHAIEPFFSTKQEGQGMGLGLFLTRTVAEQLGGALMLESTAGEGTSATIEVPV